MRFASPRVQNACTQMGAPSMGLVGIEPVLPSAGAHGPVRFRRAAAEGAAMSTDAGVALALSIGDGLRSTSAK
jgi:hypothetical protein